MEIVDNIKVLNQENAKIFLKKFSNFDDNWQIDKVAGDASFRSYYRVFLKSKPRDSLILMYAPVGLERIDHFIAIDKILLKYNFSAPQIFAIDETNGMLLLEDFGDNSFGKILIRNKNRENDLYEKAINLLLELHKVSNKILTTHDDIKEYNKNILLGEVMLFIDWYLLHKKYNLGDDLRKIYIEEWNKIFDNLIFKNDVLVLRDYHVDNLMEIENRKGIFSVGLLDFQDALIGSPSYDLVSLLEDARRDVSVDVRQKMLNNFLQKTHFNPEDILNDYKILSLQRNIKILGIFARLSIRDKKDNYLNFLPRVEQLVLDRLNDSIFKNGKLARIINDIITKQ